MTFQPCIKTELSLFDPPFRQVAMERALWMDVYPITSLEGEGPVEFQFMGAPGEYLDLNDTVLYVKMKVVKKDGSVLTATDTHITPANLTLSSLFSDVTLCMNETVVEGGHFLYPYKAMMNSLLQFGNDVKTTQLELAGFHETEATRKGWVANSSLHEFMGPLHLDFFCQSKYLLPGVAIRVKLSRSPIDFVIQNNGTKAAVKLLMEKACLFVRKVRVNPIVLRAHEDGLQEQNAIYPIQQSELVSYTIPSGTSYHMQDNLFRGQMPKLLVVGLVSNAAFNGDAKTDPMKFEHFKVNYVSLQRDGESAPYLHPLQPDFVNSLVGDSYISMIQGLELYNKNLGNAITMDKFINGSTLFVFNLTPDLSASGACGQPHQPSNLRLELKFASALTKGINVIILAIRDGCVEITKDRQVLKV